MKLYHAVASERSEDGTQIIDMGLYETKKEAEERINSALDCFKKDFENGHISKEEMRAWEGNAGSETYEWVADILTINVMFKLLPINLP